MWRYELIQKYIDIYQYHKYLEIGLGKECENFRRIEIECKIGIDPYKPVTVDELLSENVKYYEMDSNTYLEYCAKEDLTNLDIAFIDGLHEYRQVMHEVDMLLGYLSPNGVILIHDCNPFSPEMARPYNEITGYSQDIQVWMGDVWKSIPLLRKKYKDYNVYVYDTDCGIGVITKQNMEGLKRTLFNDEEIVNMSYKEFEQHRNDILDLLPINEKWRKTVG